MVARNDFGDFVAVDHLIADAARSATPGGVQQIGRVKDHGQRWSKYQGRLFGWIDLQGDDDFTHRLRCRRRQQAVGNHISARIQAGEVGGVGDEICCVGYQRAADRTDAQPGRLTGGGPVKGAGSRIAEG